MFCGDLGQEPTPAFCLVDPSFDQAGGGDIAMFGAHFVRGTQIARQFHVVAPEFGQYVARREGRGIVCF